MRFEAGDSMVDVLVDIDRFELPIARFLPEAEPGQVESARSLLAGKAKGRESIADATGSKFDSRPLCLPVMGKAVAAGECEGGTCAPYFPPPGAGARGR